MFASGHPPGTHWRLRRDSGHRGIGVRHFDRPGPMTEPLDLPRHPAIRVAAIEGRGRGVVAIEPIRHGELIEAAPVVRLTGDASPPRASPLYDYVFAWDEPPFAEAIALGVLSLVNHSAVPNATIHCDLDAQTIRLVASRDIAAGEEIVFDYGVPLWFEAA